MGNKANKPVSQICAGYTLIELVLVMAIICTLAGTLIANLDFGTASDISSPDRDLEKAIRETQSLSMYKGSDYSIEWCLKDDGDEGYVIKDPSSNVVSGQCAAGSEPLTPPDNRLHIRPHFNISFDTLGRPATSSTLWGESLNIELYRYADPDNPAEDNTTLIGTVHVEKNTGAVWTVVP